MRERAVASLQLLGSLPGFGTAVDLSPVGCKAASVPGDPTSP